MNPEEQKTGTALVKSERVSDLKDIDAIVKELQVAYDAKDDVKLGEALTKLAELVTKFLNAESQTTSKSDPFAEKVAKYASQAK